MIRPSSTAASAPDATGTGPAASGGWPARAAKSSPVAGTSPMLTRARPVASSVVIAAVAGSIGADRSSTSRDHPACRAGPAAIAAMPAGGVTPCGQSPNATSRKSTTTRSGPVRVKTRNGTGWLSDSVTSTPVSVAAMRLSSAIRRASAPKPWAEAQSGAMQTASAVRNGIRTARITGDFSRL